MSVAVREVAPGFSSMTGGEPVLRSGSVGAAVVTLQTKLKLAGFNPGPLDGDFGPGTGAAVMAFQRSRGLSPDGVVGPVTWGALDHLPSGGASPTVHSGGRGAPIMALQARLNALGFNCGKPDGVFGPLTLAATRSFQRSRHLPDDGVVGPASWTALGIHPTGAVTYPGEVGGVSLGKMPARFRQWVPFAKAAAQRFGLSPALLLAVMSRESDGYNIRGDFGHGRGLMQIDDRSWGTWLASHGGGMDPASNIMKGAEILKSAINFFGGNLRDGLAAYNAGAGGVQNALRHGRSPDSATTGGNYGSDVLQRVSMFV